MRGHALGFETEAEFIRDWFILMDKHGRDTYLPPRGFKRLGSGAYRVAYLSEETNVVYKVEQTYGRSYDQSNEEEYLNLRSMMLRKLPETVRFPKYHLWRLDGRTVAAMEYLPKLLNQYGGRNGGQKWWEAKRDLCLTFPDLWDSHGANIAVDEEAGKIVPIDLGGYCRDGHYS